MPYQHAYAYLAKLSRVERTQCFRYSADILGACGCELQLLTYLSANWVHQVDTNATRVFEFPAPLTRPGS